MRTCVKPQFWQSFSTRTPGWKSSPSASEQAPRRWNAAPLSTFTSEGLSRRRVSLFDEVTTTWSSMKASGCTLKFSSTVCAAFTEVSSFVVT